MANFQGEDFLDRVEFTGASGGKISWADKDSNGCGQEDSVRIGDELFTALENGGVGISPDDGQNYTEVPADQVVKTLEDARKKYLRTQGVLKEEA